MKKKDEKELVDLLSLYGSLEDYEEEQRRCGLVAIEKAGQLNPFVRRMSFDKFWPSGKADTK